tara:strand:+ start:11563 stop:12465 length:903 start_codon:yes stop_codon:yes gene_type:complete
MLKKVDSSGVLAVIYGPSKTGKSTATGAAGAGGLFIAQPGGLLPVTNFLGLEGIEYLCPKDVESAAKAVSSNAGKYPTIVVDDFSLLVEQTVQQLEQKHSFGDMWRALRHQVLLMRDAARTATAKGTHVIFNCHETPPKTSSGKYVRGGPKLPGQLPEQFSAFADVVARVQFDATASPWKYVLRTGPDAEFVSGDRLAVFPDPAPINLAEALRCAGYDFPRPKGLEWQEKIVDQLSKKLLEGSLLDWRQTLKPAADKLQSKYPLPHIRWAMQDALHRAILLNARNNLLDEMFVEKTSEDW